MVFQARKPIVMPEMQILLMEQEKRETAEWVSIILQIKEEGKTPQNKPNEEPKAS